MNETLKTIHSLRSIHGNFSDREVSDQDLQTILQATVRAATASAQQSYSIIVVDDKEVMKEYLDYVGSKALIFCADANRLHDIATHIGCDYESDDIQSFVTNSTDTILAAQTAAIAAKSLGIDSLFTNSVHRRNLEAFARKFNLPKKRCFPLITLILGYPNHEPGHQRGRLSGPGIIHYGSYQRLTDPEMDAIVDAYTDPERHLSWSEGVTGRAHLEWYFNVWFSGFKPADSTQEEIKTRNPFYDFLERAGYIQSDSDKR